MVTYRFRPGFLLSRVGASVLRSRPRPFAEEARAAFARYRSHVAVVGAEHVPPAGPLLVVSNHYQRPGMGPEWTGIAVSTVLAELMSRPDIRWMHTDGALGYRLFDRYNVPGFVAGWFMRWMSKRYGFLPVASIDVAVRAPMLRVAYRLLHQQGGVVGIMPEGGNAGEDGSLGPAKPGAGAALSWLSAGAIPVVPVAVHDGDDGALVVAFGPTFIPPRRARSEVPSSDPTEDVMRRIASLLPPSLHGHYAAAGH